MDIANESSSYDFAELNRRNIFLLNWNHGEHTGKGEIEKISIGVGDLNLDTVQAKDESSIPEYDDNITMAVDCIEEQIELENKSSTCIAVHGEETIVEKLFPPNLYNDATVTVTARGNDDAAGQPSPVQRTVNTSTTPGSLQSIARKRLVPPPNLATTSRRRPRGSNRRGRRGRRSIDTDSDSDSPKMSRGCRFNDLEILRRLGLRKLFMELQDQIPAIKNKERAPKDVVLREATVLCRQLRQEDLEREKLKMKQHQLVMKVEELRTALSRHRML